MHYFFFLVSVIDFNQTAPFHFAIDSSFRIRLHIYIYSSTVFMDHVPMSRPGTCTGELLFNLCTAVKEYCCTMPLEWEKDTKEFLSAYHIEIDGAKLKCFLCRMTEAQDIATYAYIKQEFGKEVHAVGVAKGEKQEGECHESKYPSFVKVIQAPIYFQGSLRTKRLDQLWAECKIACRENRAILIHCTNSFHRGPGLLAAIMIKAGSTKKAAFQYIAQKRTIFHGHVLDITDWPTEHQQHHATEKLLEVHEWLEKLAQNNIYAADNQQNLSRQFDDTDFLRDASKDYRVWWLLQHFQAEELQLAALRKAVAELISEDIESLDVQNNPLSSRRKQIRPVTPSASPSRRSQSRQPPTPPWKKRRSE